MRNFCFPCTKISPPGRNKIIFLSFLFFFLGIFYKSLDSAETLRVIIVPFKINSQENIDFLKEGIGDMLSSRISLPGRIELLAKEELKRVIESDIKEKALEEKDMKEIANRLKADYLIYGSITKMGDSLSIDGKTFRAKEGNSVPFYILTDTKTIFPKVSELAQTLQDQILGRATSARREREEIAPPLQVREDRLAKEKDEESSFSRIDPRYLEAGREKSSQQSLWTSQRFSLLVKSFDIGDLNGDGKNEMVFVESNKLYIYRLEKRTLVLIKKIEGERADNFIRVDIADINKNGIPEIIVTGVRREEPRSIIFEAKKKEYVPIAKDLPYFLRVIPVQGGNVMLAQEVSQGNQAGNLYVMEYNKGKYLAQKKISVPVADIYEIVYLAKNVEGLPHYLVKDSDDFLTLLDPQGRRVWRSTEAFGGTDNYWEKNPSEEREDKDRIYIPTRVLVKEVAKGRWELILARNSFIMGGIFQKQTFYKKAEIYNLLWDEEGLKESWKAKEMDGYIADLQFKDLDNDGRPEIVAAVVQNASVPLLTKGKTTMVAFSLYR